MKNIKPTKVKTFTFNDYTWTRDTMPGRVRFKSWTAYIHADGHVHSYGSAISDQVDKHTPFAVSARQAIATLWQTIDIPEVFRTKVDGVRRSVRWVKGDQPNTVRLIGDGWSHSWRECRVSEATRAQALLPYGFWCSLNDVWAPAVRAAVAHFWGPELRHDHAPVSFSERLFIDPKCPDRPYFWVKRTQGGRVSRHTIGDTNPSDIQWSRRDLKHSQCWAGLKEALDHHWPLGRSVKADSADGWSFTCAQDEVDIARCLREAYAAGFREVTIDDGRGQPNLTMFHRSVWDLIARSGVRGFTTNFTGLYGGDWAPVDEPGLLARARAWEAAQKPTPVVEPAVKHVTVTLKGTR